MKNPTEEADAELRSAYAFFNAELFAGRGFAKACERLLGKDFQISWVDRAEDEPERKPRTTRTKYTCKGCGLNVWAKPDASIRCGDCDRPLHAAA